MALTGLGELGIVPSGMPNQGARGWWSRGRWVWLMLVSWSLLAGVARGQAEPPSDEVAVLRARVDSFWQAEAQKDYVISYQLLEPQVRAALPLPDYVRPKRYLTVRSFSVEGIEVRGDSATVRVRYEFEVEVPPPPPGMERPPAKGPVLRQGVIGERWVRVGNAWFRMIQGVQGSR